jgi:hypothetical protein
MQFEKLTIGLRQTFGKPGPNNPFEATLSVGYNDNKMQVRLSDATCRRILALAGDEIAAAAQVQISEFIRDALTVSATPMIEGNAGREVAVAPV